MRMTAVVRDGTRAARMAGSEADSSGWKTSIESVKRTMRYSTLYTPTHIIASRIIAAAQYVRERASFPCSCHLKLRVEEMLPVGHISTTEADEGRGDVLIVLDLPVAADQLSIPGSLNVIP